MSIVPFVGVGDAGARPGRRRLDRSVFEYFSLYPPAHRLKSG